MRTTIDLDDSLFARLQEIAHREGLTFRAVLHRVIQRGLEPFVVLEPQYAAPVASMGAVRKRLDLHKARWLVDALEDEAIAGKLRI